jgi:asparagine synthase (glutamine-hydrolysing)
MIILCGIAGFVTQKDTDYSKIIQSMIDEIHYRGPDSEDFQIFTNGDQELVYLGHKRLSIIDLSENGKQPMSSLSGQTSIVFNGEIYNYQELRKNLEDEGWAFKTHTDTEVILNLYEKHGVECLRFLNGMYAFTIYDKKRDQIFIARDRLGIRPLYYAYEEGSHFVFASEMKSILKFPHVKRKVNDSALIEYVKNRYVSNPETVFDGIHKLQPGHYLVYKGGKVILNEYWDIKQFQKVPIPFTDAVSQVDHLLRDSVRLRMISDVPVGAFLSGGLDSSLIVAMMSEYSNAPIKTFSVGLEQAKYSEHLYAREVANIFRTDHHELILKPNDFIDNMYQAVKLRGAPLSETADIPIYMLSVQAKKKVSVILTGEGADELFAGYPKYAFDQFSKTLWFKTLLNNKWSSRFIRSLPFEYRKLKTAYDSLCIKNDLKRYTHWFSSFDDETIVQLFSDEYKNTYLPDNYFLKYKLHGKTNLDRMQYMDVKYWLSDNLLERGDRMLMGASVEGRLPFLDFRMAELAFQIPESYKINKLKGKYILKTLAKRYLPSEIVNRKKVGFYIPVGDWFKKELKDFTFDHLFSSSFRERGIFNLNKIEEMLDLHCKGIVNYEKEIWMLLNLEIWFRSCVDHLESDQLNHFESENLIVG